MRDATGTSDCRLWSGASNTVAGNCFLTTNDGYSGEPAGSGISPGFNGKYATVSESTITVLNPHFGNRHGRVHAGRDYRVYNAACSDYQPQGPVGPPVP